MSLFGKRITVVAPSSGMIGFDGDNYPLFSNDGILYAPVDGRISFSENGKGSIGFFIGSDLAVFIGLAGDDPNSITAISNQNVKAGQEIGRITGPGDDFLPLITFPSAKIQQSFIQGGGNQIKAGDPLCIIKL